MRLDEQLDDLIKQAHANLQELRANWETQRAILFALEYYRCSDAPGLTQPLFPLDSPEAAAAAVESIDAHDAGAT
jgi:hypothetical protein